MWRWRLFSEIGESQSTGFPLHGSSRKTSEVANLGWTTQAGRIEWGRSKRQFHESLRRKRPQKELLSEWKSAQPHRFKTRKMANQKSLRQFLFNQVASRYSKRPSFHSLDRSDCEITALRCWRRNSPSTHQKWFESENPQSRHSCLKRSRFGSDSISNDQQLCV